MRNNGTFVGNVLRHARRHSLSLVALGCAFLALGGASYAALQLPAGAVGAREIRNRTITPVKFAPSAIGGVVRHWAVVSAAGRVLDASSRAHAQRGGNVVTVDWGDKFSGRCIPLVTIHGIRDVHVGAAEAAVLHGGTPPSRVAVTGSNGTGQPVAQPFYVAVIC